MSRDRHPDKVLARREFLLRAAALGGSTVTLSHLDPESSRTGAALSSLPLWRSLPRWRGFNLLGMFYQSPKVGFDEWHYDFIAEHGFDFVRLPLDYRIWTIAPGQYREEPLKELDRAIAMARSRGIHTCLNLHRAPGWTVAKPPEKLDLWGNEPDSTTAQQLFAQQWEMLAQRYRALGPRDLSFNLLNEPPEMPGTVYRQVIAPAVEAIRSHSPDRLIIADGARWATRPVAELESLALAQSGRGYTPMRLTHYKAQWIDGSQKWPEPQWPLRATFNAFLYGPFKQQLQSPLVLRGDFIPGTRVTLRVGRVSNRADLVVLADQTPLIRKLFQPQEGAGEWKSSSFSKEHNVWSAEYDRDYAATISGCVRELRLSVEEGDWLSLSEIRIEFPEAAAPLVLRPTDETWGARQGILDLSSPGGQPAATADSPIICGVEQLWKDVIGPWAEFAAQRRVGALIGEWGTHNATSHPLALAWMRDSLRLFRRASLGWALWNLEGSFGPVNSDRNDVTYESYKGRKLDRKMLELLKADGA